MGAEAVADRLHALGHARGPAPRRAFAVAGVELRSDAALQQVVDRGSVARVLLRLIGNLGGAADRPAVAPPAPRVVSLRPPAVEDRAVDPAVQRRLHPAGAAGLLRAQRVVEPDIAAAGE